MAKKNKDSDLFDSLRLRGVRGKVAKALSEAPGQETAAKAIDDLRAAAAMIEQRLTGGDAKPASRGSSSKPGATRRRTPSAAKGPAGRSSSRTTTSSAGAKTGTGATKTAARKTAAKRSSAASKPVAKRTTVATGKPGTKRATAAAGKPGTKRAKAARKPAARKPS